LVAVAMVLAKFVIALHLTAEVVVVLVQLKWAGCLLLLLLLLVLAQDILKLETLLQWLVVVVPMRDIVALILQVTDFLALALVGVEVILVCLSQMVVLFMVAGH
jgi:hypothetical protein